MNYITVKSLFVSLIVLSFIGGTAYAQSAPGGGKSMEGKSVDGRDHADKDGNNDGPFGGVKILLSESSGPFETPRAETAPSDGNGVPPIVLPIPGGVSTGSGETTPSSTPAPGGVRVGSSNSNVPGGNTLPGGAGIPGGSVGSGSGGSDNPGGGVLSKDISLDKNRDPKIRIGLNVGNNVPSRQPISGVNPTNNPAAISSLPSSSTVCESMLGQIETCEQDH
ncbi:MAG: hypothetical protein K1X44_03765 [Alphaproteobacteria bacterium]|nr:hypothetical protein [Alphaproteobacteria bacterium]